MRQSDLRNLRNNKIEFTLERETKELANLKKKARDKGLTLTEFMKNFVDHVALGKRDLNK